MTPDCQASRKRRRRPTARAKCGSSITLSISLHLADWDVSKLPLIERKALLEPLVANKPGLQFNGHDAGDGELILEHAGKLGFEASSRRRSTRPTRQGTVAYGAKPKRTHADTINADLLAFLKS